MRWCFAALCEEVEVFERSSFVSERTDISELLTLNICLMFLVELAYCEPVFLSTNSDLCNVVALGDVGILNQHSCLAQSAELTSL